MTLDTMDSLVSFTPAGVRVEPEVYCRNAVWCAVSAPAAPAASAAARSSPQLWAKVSGSASTAMTRGRCPDGRSAK